MNVRKYIMGGLEQGYLLYLTDKWLEDFYPLENYYLSYLCYSDHEKGKAVSFVVFKKIWDKYMIIESRDWHYKYAKIEKPAYYQGTWFNETKSIPMFRLAELSLYRDKLSIGGNAEYTCDTLPQKY